MLRKIISFLLLSIIIIAGAKFVVMYEPLLLVYMTAVPLIVWYGSRHPRWLNGNKILALRIMRLINLLAAIITFFYLSFFQTSVAAMLTEGHISTQLSETRRRFHPVTSDTVCYFTAKNPAHQWYAQAILYLLIVLIIAAVLSMFAVLRSTDERKT